MSYTAYVAFMGLLGFLQQKYTQNQLTFDRKHIFAFFS